MVGNIRNVSTKYYVNTPGNLPQRIGHISRFKPEDVYVKGSEASKTRQTNPNTHVNRIPIALQYSPKQVLKAYLNKEYLNSLLEKTPEVKEILNSVGINNPEACPENVLKIMGHITSTTAYALQIADAMRLSPVDKKILEQGAVFHDFGKVMIPKEILEKPGALTPHERRVMDTHAILGEKLLAPTGLNKTVVELAGNHHNQNTDNILCQILSVADIYSALREARSYKKAMPVGEALKILDQKAENGEVSTEVVDALKSSLMAACA